MRFSKKEKIIFSILFTLLLTNLTLQASLNVFDTVAVVLSDDIQIESIGDESDNSSSASNHLIGTYYDLFYNETTQEITDTSGLRFKSQINGVITINDDRYLAFALKGIADSQEYIYTSMDFDWTWHIETDGTNYTFWAENDNQQFVWKQYYHFYADKSKSMKIEHYLENNWKDISDAQMYYLTNVKLNDTIEYNKTQYLVEGYMGLHIQRNLNGIIPLINFNSEYDFLFGDLINDDFIINEFYIGSGSIVGKSNINILAIGFTKNNGNFPKGALIWIDPEISGNDIKRVSMTPLDESTFVIAYHDETNDDMTFQILETDGTVVVAAIDIDTDVSFIGGPGREISVSAFSSTRFVVAYWDDTDDNFYGVVYDNDGNVVTSAFLIYDGHGDFIAVSALNSTHFAVGRGYLYGIFASKIMTYEGNNHTAWTTHYDTSSGSGKISLDISAFNETRYIFAYMDDDTDKVCYSIMEGSTSICNDETLWTMGTYSIGNFYNQIGVSALNNTHAVISAYDRANGYILYGIVDSDGDIVVSNEKAASLTALASSAVDVCAVNSTSFAILFTDDVPPSNDAAYFLLNDTNGNSIVGKTDVTYNTENFYSHEVMSQESAIGSGIYDDNFIISYIDYASSTYHTYWECFYSNNGTIWDGEIPAAPENDPPSYTGESIWDGTTNHPANSSCVRFPPVSFNITANDPEGDTMNITWERNGLTLNTTSGTNGTYRAYNTSFASSCGTTYYYNVSINDGNNNWRNQSFSFTTVSNPTIHLKTPTNSSTTSKTPVIHVQANDSCSLALNVYWYENTTGTWILKQTNSSVSANSSVYWTHPTSTEFCKTFYYRVAVNNSYCNITYQYQFTTPTVGTLTITNSSPTNNSYENTLSFTFNATIESPHGDTFNWTIWCSNAQSSSANYASNGSKTLSISGLKYCTQYFVWVNATGNCSTTTKSLYYFNTVNSTTPTFSNEVPANTSIDTEFDMTWNVTIEQAEGEWFQVWLNSSHGETNIGDGHNASYPLPISGLDWCTKYYVTVTVSTNCSSVTEIFEFTTKSMAACTFSNEDPIDTSVGTALNTNFQVDITSPNSEYFNYTIESNSGNTTSANDQTTGTKTLEMYELAYSTLYTVWVNTTNNCSNDSSDTYHFTTLDATDYTPPTINVTTAVPSNNSWEIDKHSTQLNIWINDSASLFNWTIELSNGNSSFANGVSNGTKICYVNLSYCTDYIWWVNATDGTNTSNATLYFHTENISTSVFSNENPANNSYENQPSFTWNTTIENPDGEQILWWINCSDGSSSTGNNYNGSKTLSLSNLDYCTNYVVFVNATNNCSQWTYATYYFNTRNSTATTLSYENPTNGSIDQEITLTWNVTILSPDGEEFTWWINCSNGQTNSGTGYNGSKTLSLTNLDHCTNFTIRVNVTDNCSVWTKAYYHIVTKDMTACTFTGENPTNNSCNQEIGLTWNTTILSPDGESFNWTIEGSNGQSSSANGAFNGSKTLSLTGLSYYTQYTIWVNTTNNCSTTANVIYHFTTRNRTAITYSFENPTNNSVNQEVSLTWNITMTTIDGGTFTWWINSSSGHTNSGATATNGSKSLSLSGLTHCTSYTIQVNATNENDNWTYATYHFTTASMPAVTFSNPNPTNNSGNNALSFTWNTTLISSSGEYFNWTIHCSNGQSNNANSEINGSKTLVLNGLSYNTQYIIWVNTTNNCSNDSKIIYYFTTRTANAPAFSFEVVTNNSYDVPITTNSLNVTIEDPDGDTFNWTIECTNGDSSSANDASNGSKSVTLSSGLEYCTLYYWYVNATDGINTTKAIYNFNTGNISASTFSNPSPANNSYENAVFFTWNVTIENPLGEEFTWWINSSHGETNSGVGYNGSKTLSISGLSYCTKYEIQVNATNNCSQWTYATYCFYTKNMSAAIITGPDPANNSEDNALSFTWNVTIEQPEGAHFNWTIVCSNGDSSSATGAANGSKMLDISGLTYSNSYTVWVNVTNNCSVNSYATYYFTAMDEPPNNPPAQSNPSPSSGTACVYPPHQTCIQINDAEGSQMNVTFLSNSSGSWLSFGENLTINNGTYCWNNSNFSTTNTTYYWSVNVSDGLNWTNATYHFTTLRCPYIVLVLPTNGSADSIIAPIIQILAQDYCSQEVSVFFYQNTSGSWIHNQTNASVTANSTLNWIYDNATQYLTTYYFRVAINNTHCNATYEFYFTTRAAPGEVIPGLELIYPTNNSNNICPCNGTIDIVATHPHGLTMNITYYTYSNVWFNKSLINVSNGTYNICLCSLDIVLYNTTYQWYVNATDYANETRYNQSVVYQFKTAENATNCSASFTPTSYAWVLAVVLPFSIFGIIVFVKKRRN